MPNTRNIAQVQLLQEKASRAKSVILAEYAGLTVKQQTQLRREIKQAGGEFLVAKNTLLARTFGKEQLNQSLQGQTAVVFCYDDEVSPLKALVQFSKDNTLPQIRQGLLDGSVLSEEEVMNLSKLPNKLELIGQLLGRLNAPGSKLVGVLMGVQRNLVYALEAIRKQKEGVAV